MGVTVNITIMGAGDLQEDCRAFAARDFGSVTVAFRDPVEYGSPFFATLRCYDAVLVPNLKEEQPRIIFDAFSQGLGVIAADTSGILDITRAGENAVICKRGDARSLAEAIAQVVGNPDMILRMGLSGLSYADGKTHVQMHLDRQRFFASVFA